MSAISSLIKLSQATALAPLYTQGAGGNTSVKENNTMLIKASGFRLDEVSLESGFVKVSNPPIAQYLQNSQPSSTADTDLKTFVSQQIIGDSKWLPSMETGFHAVLKKYVIHTHPIAVNQLLCCTQGPELMAQIFKNYNYALIPFVNPGYYLSKAIANLSPNIPPILFLQNHGLIVHADSETEAIHLHQEVINLFPKIETDFKFELLPLSENTYKLVSTNLAYINKSVLQNTYFPDQAVVIGPHFQFNSKNQSDIKLNITDNAEIIINSTYKNALAMAENLLALSQIVEYSIKHQLTLQPLPLADVAYILGMDMEKYRQNLLK